MDLTSDNPAGADFDDIPVAGSYRVLLAVPQRFM
jgi:hypothetical protein